jgi:preprotein translocase SecE subunit
VASGRGRGRLLEGGDALEDRAQYDLGPVPVADADAVDGDEGLTQGAPEHLTGELPGPAGDGAPDPLEQAAPDAEVAQARLATASRPEAVDEEASEEGPQGRAVEMVSEPAVEVRGESAPAPAQHAAVAVPRPWLGTRLLAFLEGSWRELQRVQWPDRRQVMQATGVVIGFVIVASVFLGVADFLAGKIVHFVLNGTF